MYLIFDTETTGFFNKQLPLDHPEQARICQLAMLLLDSEFNEVSQFNSLIKLNNCIMSPGAEAVHKHSAEKCNSLGINISTALSVFDEFNNVADKLVAHNIDFDANMLNTEMTLRSSPSYHWKGTQEICTMKAMTEICRLPGKFGKYKWPKLSEAYEFLFHSSFDKAHDALADVRACAKIFKWLISEGKIPLNIGAIT